MIMLGENSRWIGTDNKNDKRNTLAPELFRKSINISERPTKAELYVTSMGIYEASISGCKVGDAYFTPGYTHYESYLQYQRYDVTEMLREGENIVDITVANGWWLGGIGRKNNNYGNRRGLIAELHLTYAGGNTDIIGTDKSWCYTTDTPTSFADFYNGETIDKTKTDEGAWRWSFATEIDDNRIELCPHIGAFVKEDQRLIPEKMSPLIYDFKQNHAGIIHLKVEAKKGTVIKIRHGEILDGNGDLFTKNLRGAKQELTLVCGKDGIEEFCPRFTFMGFRYAEVTSSAPINIIHIESIVLTSDCKEIGSFSCSDELLTKLWSNITWGQKSNFIDIPTDCPQRDERMGWTGDIAVFAQTAATNRDISAFMDKWLSDLRLYQRPNGTLPVTVPENKTYEPTPLKVPIAIWGDAATMVPWAVYRAYGDKEMLRAQYDSMKAYTESEIRAASRFSKGKKKYLWSFNPFQYGDWCAPGESFGAWKRKGKYLATYFLANSVDIMRRSASTLGKAEDERYFAEIHDKIKDAFASLCIAPDGRLKGHFQSNYVCALYFGLVPDDKKSSVAYQLVNMVRENGHRIGTGFAGTPYIAFALADNGYAEDAYKLLQNTSCPGWLYTIKAGGTTIWERWDALDENGRFYKGGGADMVSFNHYAYGAVGDFFYRRILGIEPIEEGYRSFSVMPIPGGTLTWAKGGIETRHGKISVDWSKSDGTFYLKVAVPQGTKCTVSLPGGDIYTVLGGEYEYTTKEHI